jgi:hypothetical protein
MWTEGNPGQGDPAVPSGIQQHSIGDIGRLIEDTRKSWRSYRDAGGYTSNTNLQGKVVKSQHTTVLWVLGAAFWNKNGKCLVMETFLSLEMFLSIFDRHFS